MIAGPSMPAEDSIEEQEEQEREYSHPNGRVPGPIVS
jgi:hypothetical protein